MIHEAYMPVYRCPDFHCAGAGSPEVVQEALADLKSVIIFLSCGGRSLHVYVAFTLTHETLWNSLSEAKVSVNLRKVSWLGLLLVGGRTIREGGDQLCAGAGRHSIKGVQQQLPPIHQEQ